MVGTEIQQLGLNDRSFDVFSRWFDYHHHSVLIDLCDEPLIEKSD